MTVLLSSRTSKKGIWPTVEFIRDQVHKIPFFGAHGDEEIPVLIPNTEVKLISGDYTATSGKLARRRIIQMTLRIGGFLFYIRYAVASTGMKNAA